MAEAVKALPTQRQTEEQSGDSVSKMIVNLPQYFEELQKILARSAASKPVESTADAVEYQKAMLQKAKDAKTYFDNVISSKEGLYPATSSVINYFKIMSQLALQSYDVLNAAKNPLTQQAYSDVATKLEVIKHNYLPQVIAELEQIEESMGLKAGLLTEPAMAQMNKYYTQLASTVHNIARTAGALEQPSARKGAAALSLAGEKISPKADLLVMEDEGFSEQRRSYQEVRLSGARIDAADTDMRAAANRFFDRLNAYGRIYQAYCKWSLANISQEEKNALIADYKKFQPHFAAVHPEIDKLIVDTLTIPTESTIVSRLLSAQYKQLWGSNHFSEVLTCRAKVEESIEQSLAQAQFEVSLIEKSISHAENTSYIAAKKKTSLNLDVLPFQALTIPQGASAEQYHQKAAELEQQIIQLERAKEGAEELFVILKKAKPGTNIALLGEEAKEALRKAYKKFQSQLITMTDMGVNSTELNAGLVQSLSAKESSDPPVLVSDLMSIQTGVSDKLNALLAQAQGAKKEALALEHELREKAPLVVKAAELEKRTLFGMLHDLKLSQSVDKFITGKLQNYLKEHLSPVVWNELSRDGRLDMSRLPYTELHKDSSDVVLYKQLINSMYYIHKGLKELEQINTPLRID